MVYVSDIFVFVFYYYYYYYNALTYMKYNFSLKWQIQKMTVFIFEEVWNISPLCLCPLDELKLVMQSP